MFVAAYGALACSQEPPESARDLCINEFGTPPVMVGDTFTIEIGPYDDSDRAYCLEPSTAPRVWLSTNAAVLEVDSGGSVTALDTGTATVTLEHQGRRVWVTFRIMRAFAQLAITPASAEIAVGDSLVFQLSAHDSTGRPVPGSVAAWFVPSPLEFYAPGARPRHDRGVHAMVTVWAHDTGETYVKAYTRALRDSARVQIVPK
jgi:hypothetical protein